MSRVIGFAWILLSLPVIGLAARTLIADLQEGWSGRSWCPDCATSASPDASMAPPLVGDVGRGGTAARGHS